MNSKEIASQVKDGKNLEEIFETMVDDGHALITARKAVTPAAIKAVYLEIDGRWQAACRLLKSDDVGAFKMHLAQSKKVPRDLFVETAPRHARITHEDNVQALAKTFVRDFKIAIVEVEKLLSNEYPTEQKEREAARVVIELFAKELDSNTPAQYALKVIMEAVIVAQREETRFNVTAFDLLNIVTTVYAAKDGKDKSAS
jgi:hypothetical protein